MRHIQGEKKEKVLYGLLVRYHYFAKGIEEKWAYRKTREWDGNMYSSSPAIYVTDSNLEFVEVEDKTYFNRIIGQNFTDDSICLHLKSDHIKDFEFYVNKHIYIEENELLVYLKNLYELSCFYILLVREDEKIKNRYKIVDADEIESILIDSIDWEKPNDILLYK